MIFLATKCNILNKSLYILILYIQDLYNQNCKGLIRRESMIGFVLKIVSLLFIGVRKSGIFLT